MTAPAIATSQLIASFVLHTLWQVPLLAVAAALAVRIGRPQARVAHIVWAATLLLCVLMPLASTGMARRAAIIESQRTGYVSITFQAADNMGNLPALQRTPLWQRVLNRHFNRHYGVTPFAVALPLRIARVVAAIYALIALCLALRLIVGWRRSRQLVMEANAIQDESPTQRSLLRQCHTLGLKPPPIRMSEDIAGPALAGAFHPTLLLPSCAAEMSIDEMDAVLAHELAHLRRNDPPLHLACSLLLVPVGFHPAALWVAKRVRQTREMACDAEAAAHMGSAAIYARALLQVAERTGAGDVQAGLGLFSSGLGLFNTGLELSLTGGAMEERMRMMMSNKQPASAAVRAARWSACVAVGGAALLAAAMMQVQPAIAQQQQAVVPVVDAPPAKQAVVIEDQPRFIGGAHAQEQLRKARRDLDAAATKATSDDERNKIATARAVIGAAQQQLAAADGSHDVFALRIDPQMQVQLDALKDLKIDPKVRVMIRDLKMDPKVRVQIEKQQVDAAKIRIEIENHRAEIDRAVAEVNSPEFQAKIRAQVDEAKKHVADVKIDQAKMDRMTKDARQQSAKAMAMMNSAEVQRQIADAKRAVAQLEIPPMPNVDVLHVPDEVQAEQGKRVKISSGVMAGNIVNKTQPVYPQEAKDAHISGAVVLHALINENGKVESLQIVSSPDKSLSMSAIEAVQQWTYRPYLLNGNPTAVDTTITVNFSYGG